MSAPPSLLSRDPSALPAFDDDAGRDVRSGDDPAADDVSALRLVKVPDWPPFDGDPVAGDAPVLAAGQSGSGWAYPETGPEGGTRTGEKADGGGTDRLDTSIEWARQFARLLTEALAGARPFRQMLPWTSDRARVHIRRLMPLFDGGQRPHVLRAIATRPTRDVIEMTVVVAVGARTRALAVRLEQAGPRQPTNSSSTPGWVCTDIEAA